MVKKIYLSALFLFVICFLFSACTSSSDDYKIDEEWLNKNLNDFYRLADGNGYKKITGIADPTTYVLWKKSDLWKNSEETPSVSTSDESPIFSDSIACRYEFWFFDKDNNKIIVESTENPTSSMGPDPNKIPKRFLVSGLIDGWRTALYEMKEGDEWDIVFPYTLGYGTEPYGRIPAFTTLYYSLKLVEVKKRKF